MTLQLMYSDMSDADLAALRDKLRASLTARLTLPTVAQGSGRRTEFQQDPEQIRTELQLVQAEIARRTGTPSRGPIYVVGC
jgi:hypothetical protein